MNSLSDVDYRITGLSPQYWTHTPLLIGDLIGLPLINGVDCFIGTSHVERTATSLGPRIIPLSKVVLQGIVTAIDRRPNGCILLVLDDGSGAMDVRYWDDSYNYNDADLVGLHRPQIDFTVGDYCEVLGKIKAMSAGEKSKQNMIRTPMNTSLDVRLGCVREVHASSVCFMKRSTNGEILHWLKCLNFSRDVRQNKINSGRDMLHLLGDSISSSILAMENTDFESESSNILERKCCQTPQRFRRDLLYCHCEGTLETLDSSFTYRDAFLNHLLDMETKLVQASHSAYPSFTEDCIDLIGVESESTPPPLLFTFQSIYKDVHLSSIARKLVATTAVPEANARTLVQHTFRDMTKDGLLSLFDAEADVYLFLSLERVIGPVLRNPLGAVAPPFFLRNVPKKRINRCRIWIEKCDS